VCAAVGRVWAPGARPWLDPCGGTEKRQMSLAPAIMSFGRGATVRSLQGPQGEVPRALRFAGGGKARVQGRKAPLFFEGGAASGQGRSAPLRSITTREAIGHRPQLTPISSLPRSEYRRRSQHKALSEHSPQGDTRRTLHQPPACPAREKCHIASLFPSLSPFPPSTTRLEIHTNIKKPG
jgi:hypothetical protein